jgi:hypothetical protein
MGEFSSKKINEIDDIYQSIYSENNTELDEQQSDVSKQWERGARVVGRMSDRIATPVAGVVKSVADYAGSAVSGLTKAATGGSVDLEKIGKGAERLIGSGGGKPSARPTPTPTAKPKPTPTQGRDLGKSLGQWLVPPPEKSADPDVRSGKRTPTGKPTPTAKPTPTVKKDPKGAVIINHFESDNDSLVVEAPAQVAPVTGKGGRGWYQKNKAGKYVPITDPAAAKTAKERWETEQNKKRDPEFRTSGDWVGDPNAGKPAAPAPRPAAKPPAPAPRAAAPAPRPAAARPAAAKPAPAPQPKIEKSPAGYAVGSTGGVKFERRAATRAELDAAQAARKAAQEAGKSKSEVEKSAISAGVSASKKPVKEQTTMNDAYDLVLEYLLSQGHVDTVEEAHYVMMEMDSEFVQDIISESGYFPTPESQRADEAKYRRMRNATPPSAKTKGRFVPGDDRMLGQSARPTTIPGK